MTSISKKITWSFIFVFIFSIASFAQSELFGKWKVNCAMEQTDDASIKSCGICPVKTLENSALIQEFEMEIGPKEIKFKTENEGTEVRYKFNRNNSTIEFTYKKTDYKFKILIQSDTSISIWKDTEGAIVILKKLP